MYEDSHDDSWGGSSGSSGSYWKRSLPIEGNSAENVPIPAGSDRVSVNYQPRPVATVKQAPTYSASASNYRPTTYEEYNPPNGQLAQYNTDPHSIVYSQQMPQQTYSLK